MTETTNRKKLFWLWKILSIVVSCALPLWAIFDRFPLWAKDYGISRTAGMGIILIAIVLLVIFRKTVIDFFVARYKLNHAPPIAVWLVLLIISYILVYIGEVMRDMTIVFWMGLLGCAIGTFFTYLSEKYNDKKDVKSDE